MTSMRFTQVAQGFVFSASLPTDCETIVQLVRQLQPGKWDDLTVTEAQTSLPWQVTIGDLTLWKPLVEWILEHYGSDTGWMWNRSAEGLFIAIAGGLIYRP